MRLSGNFKKIRKSSENFYSIFSFKRPFFWRPIFFLCDFFKICFHRSPCSIFTRNETFCERTPQGFATYRRPSKMFSKNFEFFFYFLFKVFRWERMGFLLFSVGEEWFSRLTRIPSGIFWRCKIDEILISFYPWFSVWYCLFGFLQKFASVCGARLRLCVQNLPSTKFIFIFKGVTHRIQLI